MADFKLPDLGEGVTEAEVDKWLVAEGEMIAEDTPLVEVITDKATAEIPSPFGGRVAHIHVRSGEVVPVGTVLVTIETPEDAERAASGESDGSPDSPEADPLAVAPEPEGPTPEPQPVPDDDGPAARLDAGRDGGGRDTEGIKATPPVRRLARELGVDLVSVRGSGPGGRITREDVEAAARATQDAAREAEAAAAREAEEAAAREAEQVAAAREAEEMEAREGQEAAAARGTDEAAGAETDESAPGEEQPALVPPDLPPPPPTAPETPAPADVPADSPSSFQEPEDAPQDREPAAAGWPRLASPPGARDDETAAEGQPVEQHEPPPIPPVPPAPPSEGAVEGGRRESLRGIRRTIAQRMSHAHLTVPPVTHVEECDVTELDETRKIANERSPENPRLTFLPFIVKAVVSGLKEFPALNASLDDDAGEIVFHDRYDIGVAVDTPNGLIVPVVRDADQKGLTQLAGDIERLAASAREGTLSTDDLRGGTFTITSPGPFGGLMATPIVFHPQTGILGVHRATDRAVVRDGQIVIRKMMNLSITFDHRVLDGLTAAKFALHVVKLLEHPAVLTLDT